MQNMQNSHSLLLSSFDIYLIVRQGTNCSGNGLQAHIPHDGVSTGRRPNLNVEKREGEPARAEAENCLGYPEFGQMPVANFFYQMWVILRQYCFIKVQ